MPWQEIQARGSFNQEFLFSALLECASPPLTAVEHDVERVRLFENPPNRCSLIATLSQTTGWLAHDGEIVCYLTSIFRTSTGSEIVNVDPFPTTLSTATSPPII